MAVATMVGFGRVRAPRKGSSLQLSECSSNPWIARIRPQATRSSCPSASRTTSFPSPSSSAASSLLLGQFPTDTEGNADAWSQPYTSRRFSSGEFPGHPAAEARLAKAHGVTGLVELEATQVLLFSHGRRVRGLEEERGGRETVDRRLGATRRRQKSDAKAEDVQLSGSICYSPSPLFRPRWRVLHRSLDRMRFQHLGWSQEFDFFHFILHEKNSSSPLDLRM
ncbi:hypothetical protein BDK51DRAFT_44078 [Blyttiomyces helicus]|uniref:Uncharacterized protein n=1 Tax=Blyttiomyces helicus TaxID=388810 RepID=A0A4V1IRG7_9FUNG|nr:hypothetical protein BDK51DRAFT_44078 [Blyttiomyces helicus]|eukprot:RKO89997.1 hypothetical protein BDK51DRAFT_44078 [Blyttiomyces helicus]